MRRVTINCKNSSYDVLMGNGLLKEAGRLLSGYMDPCRAVLVTDDNVDALYATGVADSLEAAGFQTLKFVFPHGERSKNTTVFLELLEFLAENRITRSDVIIALGGGVTGDLAGFAASVYLRGIRFVQMPTTLLAAVDSSVGGKTGVNLKAGKNLAGAFWQPSLVIYDNGTLLTLPGEVIADGAAEVIKYGISFDKELFNFLKTNENKTLFSVERCVAIKGSIVKEDEFDTGLRQLLNFGHTVGHAVEKLSSYEISHGRAVAMGMAVITKAYDNLGMTEEPCFDSLKELLDKYGLPSSCPFGAEELASAALSDKKRSGAVLTLVVPETIGHCVLHAVPVSQLAEFFAKGLEN